MKQMPNRNEIASRIVVSAQSHLAYSVADFCRLYSIGRSKLYAEAKNGRIAFKKVGSRSIILSAEAERWAASLPEAVK